VGSGGPQNIIPSATDERAFIEALWPIRPLVSSGLVSSASPPDDESVNDPRPLLCIDVDGVLNPYFAHRVGARFVAHRVGNHVVHLEPAHGPSLLAFADRFDLVWATSWEDEANEIIGPLLGWPTLPVIHFDSEVNKTGKSPAIEHYAAGRPLVWIDDQPLRGDRAWERDRNLRIPTRILKPNSGQGLGSDHLAAITAFYERLGAR
jgi:hypothetical protein